jgi:hypothetical protein
MLFAYLIGQNKMQITAERGAMASGLKGIKHLFINRLKDKGIEECLIPGFLRLLANSLKGYPDTNRFLINKRLNYLGWPDFELDEHTYQLAMACFEVDDVDISKHMPSEWFFNNYGFELAK